MSRIISSFFATRHVQTTIPCRVCGTPLVVKRYCRNVVMQCAQCKKDAPLEEYISQMDDILEEFLENVYCDRM